MPDYSLNGLPLLETRLTLHHIGCWTADVLTTDAGSAPLAAGTTVALSLDTLQLSGTVARGGSFRGSEYTRIVGGAGGIGKNATPAAFNSVTARQVVSDLLSGAGETLSATADTTLLGSVFPSWTIRQEPVAVALSRLCDELGCIWRMLPDGTVWLGNDTWPAATLTDPALMDWHPERGEMLVGITSPELFAGQSFTLDGLGGNVSTVDYHIKPDAFRMRVLFED